jgi:hypothetical protein
MMNSKNNSFNKLAIYRLKASVTLVNYYHLLPTFQVFLAT